MITAAQFNLAKILAGFQGRPWAMLEDLDWSPGMALEDIAARAEGIDLQLPQHLTQHLPGTLCDTNGSFQWIISEAHATLFVCAINDACRSYQELKEGIERVTDLPAALRALLDRCPTQAPPRGFCTVMGVYFADLIVRVPTFHLAVPELFSEELYMLMNQALIAVDPSGDLSNHLGLWGEAMVPFYHPELDLLWHTIQEHHDDRTVPATHTVRWRGKLLGQWHQGAWTWLSSPPEGARALLHQAVLPCLPPHAHGKIQAILDCAP